MLPRYGCSIGLAERVLVTGGYWAPRQVLYCTVLYCTVLYCTGPLLEIIPWHTVHSAIVHLLSYYYVLKHR